MYAHPALMAFDICLAVMYYVLSQLLCKFCLEAVELEHLSSVAMNNDFHQISGIIIHHAKYQVSGKLP